MDWKRLLIKDNFSIKDTMKRMDLGDEKILFIIGKENLLKGAITDGDIRRHFLSSGSLGGDISKVYNTGPLYITENYDKDDVKQMMLDKKIGVLPIVNRRRRIVGAVSWTDLFGGDSFSANGAISAPLVIMAGGKGERLDPFTKILPKPLIPIGEKPIIEIIMEKFFKYGVKRYYITLNYKGEMVKLYFDGIEKKYEINYIWEDDFLGTAGSLKLLPGDIEDTFIVSNCDIIVEADYADLIKSHMENKNLLTLVGSIQHHRVPYGILHFGKKGKLKHIQEKPEFDFTINTGVYVLSKKALGFIPKKRYFDMTDLIKTLLEKKKKVGIYPVSEKSYVDTGQWEEYKKHIESLSI